MERVDKQIQQVAPEPKLTYSQALAVTLCGTALLESGQYEEAGPSGGKRVTGVHFESARGAPLGAPFRCQSSGNFRRPKHVRRLRLSALESEHRP